MGGGPCPVAVAAEEPHRELMAAKWQVRREGWSVCCGRDALAGSGVVAGARFFPLSSCPCKSLSAHVRPSAGRCVWKGTTGPVSTLKGEATRRRQLGALAPCPPLPCKWASSAVV